MTHEADFSDDEPFVMFDDQTDDEQPVYVPTIEGAEGDGALPEADPSKPSSKFDSKKHHGYCFTINNYTDEHIGMVTALYETDTNCKYLIIGFEEAPRTGTPHIQGYVYYTETVRYGTIKKRLSPHHVEPQKASKNVEAYVYCMEDGKYIEYGNRPRQGHRTDLENIKYDIKAGKDDKQISEEYYAQFCQYSRQFREFRRMQRMFKTKLFYYYVSDIKYLYDISNENDLIYKDRDDQVSIHTISDLCHIVYSRRYRYVFIPEKVIGWNWNDIKAEDLEYESVREAFPHINDL